MFSFLGKKKFVGVDIGTSVVKVVEATKNGSVYNVGGYGVCRIDSREVANRSIEVAITTAIKKALSLGGISSTRCAFGMPSELAYSDVITLSAAVPHTDIYNEALNAVIDLIPWPIDEVNFDYEVLGDCDKKKGMKRVLVAATKTESVNCRINACKRAGLNTLVVDLENQALIVVEDVFGENLQLTRAINLPNSFKSAYQSEDLKIATGLALRGLF